jgi:hypothetical protein
MLTTNQPLISLGRIKIGIPNNFKFRLTNTDSKPVVIESITVGCGSCTQASTDKVLVESSGTTNINVTFTPNSTGSQLKSITVHYKGGKLSLKFSAEVW